MAHSVVRLRLNVPFPIDFAGTSGSAARESSLVRLMCGGGRADDDNNEETSARMPSTVGGIGRLGGGRKSGVSFVNDVASTEREPGVTLATSVGMECGIRAARHVACDSRPRPAISMRTGAAAERDQLQREAALRERSVRFEDESYDVPDVLVPDSFEAENLGSDAWLERGMRELIISDETGRIVDWPWETGATGERHTGGKRRRHRLDRVIETGIFHSTAKGGMGANTVGVRRWKRFCASEGMSPHRPLDPNAPLIAKLGEEWLVMRFVASLVEDGQLLTSSAASYLGMVQGWHAKAHGVKLAAGMKLSRLPAMLKGLRRVLGESGRAVRRGIAPQALRRAMDICLPNLDDFNQANLRAALTLALQGLLRGAEFASEGKRWNHRLDLARGDLAVLSEERMVVMMRPCKNMQSLTGKTVPLVIGAGGMYVDAVQEMRNLLRVDPVPAATAATTPMFRQRLEDGSIVPLSTKRVRDWTKSLMHSIGQDPTHFGNHSYRIGGATALFAAGADPLVIRTMGRWSSDCYRIYVRACFSTTLDWSRRCGSQHVSDVAGEFSEVDCY